MTLCEFHIAGIGASAGGLAALEAFFSTIPEDINMAFVVVQHLSPDFKSHMVELLSRKCALPVHHVHDGVEVEVNNVYLIPPNKEMAISGRKLLLKEREKESNLVLPIDQFFRSLATDVHRLAVGIILSGTGSDGSKGIVFIKDAGGLVLCQDENSAQFDGMPRSARLTGAVHLTLPPERMVEPLKRYVLEKLVPEQLADEEFSLNSSSIEKVFQLLRGVSGVDFAHYKTNTIARRIQRRMQMLRLASLSDYVENLKEDRQELELLFKDLLIGVTKFFRDAEAFDVLEEKIIPLLAQRAMEKKTGLRIWVPSCASGEEAYSLAMLVDEYAAREQINLEWKIFATDIHADSLRFAANGVYDESTLEELDATRIQRYFRKDKDGYYVEKRIRDRILFAPQNLLADAPFIHIDLISCRNFLIYLQPSAQKKVLSMFHFSLRNQGVLFLGPSETPGEIIDEFDVIDSRWRIYQKQRDIRLPLDTRGTFINTRGNVPRGSATGLSSQAATEAGLLRTYDRLLDKYMPPSILIDEHFNIIHIFAGAEQFLKVRAGRSTTSLLDLIDEGLRTPIAGAVQHALREDKMVCYTGMRTFASPSDHLKINVQPLIDQTTNVIHLAIEFNKAETIEIADEEATEVNLDQLTHERVKSLESELRFTRENLQATIEELETSNEELQATNEELLASNEELQSTNEELQSVNEELYTVNTEHQKKIQELVESNDDMNNLLASTRVGVVFLDEDLRIRRFTPEIGRLFHLIAQDIGRHIGQFVNNLNYDDLEADSESCLAQDCEIEKEIEDINGVPYLFRMAPYRSSSGVRGVVLTLINIKLLKQTQEQLVIFQRMSEQTADCHILTSMAGQIIYTNPALLLLTNYNADELANKSIAEIGPIISDIDKTDFLELCQHGQTVSPSEGFLKCKNGTVIPVDSNVSAIKIGKNNYLFFSIRNISGRKIAERDLKLYKRAIDVSRNGIIITEAREDNPIIYVNKGFEVLTGYLRNEVLGKNCRFMQGNNTDATEVKKLHNAIHNREIIRTTIVNYRKNGDQFWNDLTITPVFDEFGQLTHYIGTQNDVSEVFEQQLKLAKLNAEIDSLLQSTADGIVGTDTDGICTFCNLAAVAMLGYDHKDELVGESIFTTFHQKNPDGSPRAANNSPILRACHSTTNSRVNADTFWRKDGSSFDVEYLSAHLIRQGTVEGCVVAFRDVTENRKAELALLSAQKQAESASRAKSEFLANMSHEIRTPLSAIMGFVDVLNSSLSESVHLKYLNTIKQNVYYLLDIINDVLDLSKIEAGFLDLNLSFIDVNQFLKDIYAMIAVRAHEKGIKFIIQYDTEIPSTLSTDPSHLRQIIMNLLANAIKFTDQGQVTLRVEADGKTIKFNIEDTGIGMSERTMNIIFESFSRAEDLPQRYGGTGLGLSISKRLADRLDATISVKSLLGKGSAFTITLPLLLGSNTKYVKPKPITVISNTRKNSEDKKTTDLSNYHILVVDDHKEVRDFCSLLLQKAGASIEIAGDGQEALDKIEQAASPFDIVLLDMQLPVKSGFEVATELRSQGFSGAIIALTAGVMKGDREHCLRAGCDEFLSKPIEASELLNSIAEFATSRSKKARFKIFIIEDHINTVEALVKLLSTAGYDVQYATTGADAVKLMADFKPDICLVDNHLPDTCGIDLLKQLADHQELRQTKYFALTGETEDDQIRRLLGAGFVAHIGKPVDIASLKNILQKYLYGEVQALSGSLPAGT